MEKPNSIPKLWALAIFIPVLILGLYVIQWLLQIAFYGFNSDELSTTLRPYQNHYFSFSKYFITTEDSQSKIIDDMTGVARFFSLLPGVIFMWIAAMLPLYFIKPLRKFFPRIVWSFIVILMIITFYSALFAPTKKSTFNQDEILIEKTEWVFYKTIRHIPISAVEKFEYDFFKENMVEEGTHLYSEIFAVVDGKRILLGDNEISHPDDDYRPNDEQKMDAQKTVEALMKFFHK
jgi:hypothetical protein